MAMTLSWVEGGVPTLGEESCLQVMEVKYVQVLFSSDGRDVQERQTWMPHWPVAVTREAELEGDQRTDPGHASQTWRRRLGRARCGHVLGE